MNEQVAIFLIGVLVGLYLSEYLGEMQYRGNIARIPTFLDEKENK